MAKGRPFTKRWRASERSKPVLSATVERELRDAVRSVAAKRNESVSELVARALEAELERLKELGWHADELTQTEETETPHEAKGRALQPDDRAPEPVKDPGPVKGPDLLEHLAQRALRAVAASRASGGIATGCAAASLALPTAGDASFQLGMPPLALADTLAQLESAAHATDLAEAWATTDEYDVTGPQYRRLRNALRARCKKLGLPLSTADEIDTRF